MTTATFTGLDALTSGTPITQTNVTPNLTGTPAKGTGSTVNADSSVPSGFSGNAIKIAWTTAGGAGDFREPLPSAGQTASNILRLSWYYRTSTPTPGADITLLQVNANPTTPAKAFTLTQRATNAGFRVLDSGNTNPLDVTGTYAWNTWYRIELQADNSGGLGASKITVNVYDMSGTKIGTIASTTYNMANANVFNEMRFGASGYNATAGSHAFFGIRWADSGTGDIGVFAPALSTPTVTAGTVVNPTVVAGTNGTAVASWPAVPNATSYEAWLATGSSPTQGAFTQVATGVTSPYTFVGLSGATYAIGIKAKA